MSNYFELLEMPSVVAQDKETVFASCVIEILMMFAFLTWKIMANLCYFTLYYNICFFFIYSLN